MAQHGYLREFDEGWDRGEDRDRRDEGDPGNRDRGFMFRDRDRFGDRGDRARPPRNFRSSPDEHYLAWRDRQIEALDRDYAEYCREREQQFHHDFDSWRRQRHGNPEPLQAGMTQSGLSSDPTGELQLTADEAVAPEGGPDPMATATLGTSSSRGRR
jgi:hypothetical protein